MPYIEIGNNLQTYGDKGQYQTDRSTWGFSDPQGTSISREHVGDGNYVANLNLALLVDPPLVPHTILLSRFDMVAGRSYRARLMVRANTPVGGTEIIEISNKSGDITVLDQQSVQYGELDQIEYNSLYLDFQANETISDFTGIHLLYNRQENGITGQVVLQVDQFEIYELGIDEPDCTLQIDAEATIVTPDTSAGIGNGSIEVAITGAIGNVEYSLDQAIWQDSNTFAGLVTDLYHVYVREKDHLSCIADQTFYVNEGDPLLQVAIQVVNETVLGAADGRIIITASEGVSPYQYSKDGGDSFQFDNEFNNLLPGTYTVVVKDDNNEVVAQNVTVLAGAYAFSTLRYSKNPIVFEQPQGANAAENNYRITCEVQTSDSEGVFSEALITERPPDLAGKAKFNVRLAFDGYFKPVPPAQDGDLITKITDRSIRARNRFGELWDTMTDPEVYLTTQPFMVILGGIEKRHFAEIDFFNTWLPANKKFLSWMPGTRIADKAQEDFITFLVYDQNINTLKYNIKAWYDDDTSIVQEMAVKNGVAFGQLYEFRCGPGNSTVYTIDPAKTLLKYDLWLTDQNNNVISEVITFQISRFRKSHTRYYLFLNSLGSFETLRATGLSSGDAEISSEVVNVILPSDYEPEQGEEITHNPVSQRSRVVSTGYQQGKEWVEWFQDFRLSREVYEITDGKRVRVNIESGKLPLDEDQDYQFFMRFTAREAYRNEVFTPKSI